MPRNVWISDNAISIRISSSSSSNKKKLRKRVNILHSGAFSWFEFMFCSINRYKCVAMMYVRDKISSCSTKSFERIVNRKCGNLTFSLAIVCTIHSTTYAMSFQCFPTQKPFSFLTNGSDVRVSILCARYCCCRRTHLENEINQTVIKFEQNKYSMRFNAFNINSLAFS